jgi:hypothetical protein
MTTFGQGHIDEKMLLEVIESDDENQEKTSDSYSKKTISNLNPEELVVLNQAP